MLLHFADLKHDLPGGIKRIAAFLDIEIDEEKFPAVVEHCSFDYMKRNATASVPLGGAFWDGGAQTFIHKGTNGRWKEVLSAEQLAMYDHTAAKVLTPDCRAWLEQGRSAVT